MLFIALGRADTTKLESRANVGLSYFGRITLVRFNPGSKLSNWSIVVPLRDEMVKCLPECRFQYILDPVISFF